MRTNLHSSSPTGSWLSGWLRWVTLALVSGLLVAQLAIAQELSENERAVLNVLSSHVDAQQADDLLARLNFPPSGFAKGPASGYRNWPVLRKLQAAFSGARTSTGGPGGELFLRSLSRLVATDVSNAVRSEPTLSGYFPEAPERPVARLPAATTLRYDIQKAMNPEVVSPQLRTVLLTLERYVGGIPGGLQGAIEACCALAPEAAFSIMTGAATDSAALASAIDKSGVPPSVKEKISRLLLHVNGLTNALKFEPMFKPFLSAEEVSRMTANKEWEAPIGSSGVDRSTTAKAREAEMVDAINKLAERAAKEGGLAPPSDGWGGGFDAAAGGGGGGGSGGGGGGSEHAAGNAQRYQSVLRSVDGKPLGGTPNRFSFRTLARGGGGFGGVVFGNKVEGESLPKVKGIGWLPSAPGSESGRLAVAFVDGTVGRSEELPRYVVASAYALVFGLNAGPVADEGFGLAGVDEHGARLAIPSLEPQGKPRLINLKPMVVHPLLDRTAVGRAAVMADALAFAASQKWVADRMMASGVGAKHLRLASKWLEADKGFYKITDVPSVIARDSEGTLRVVRAGAPGFDEDHRRAALLTMQTFSSSGWDDPKPDDEFRTPFYEIVPSLTRTFVAFRELNQFAQAFALVRWTRLNGATWTGEPLPMPVSGESTTWVAVDIDGGLRLLSGQDIRAAFLQFDEQVSSRTRELLTAVPASARVHGLVRDIESKRRAMLRAALASRELAMLADRQGVSGPSLANAAKRLRAEYDDAAQTASLATRTLALAESGLASVSDVQKWEQVQKEREEKDRALFELELELDAFMSLRGRMESAAPSDRAKVEGLLEERDASIAKSWSSDPGTRLAAVAEQKKLDAEIAKALPPPPKGRVNEIEGRIKAQEARVRELKSTADALLAGPMKTWSEVGALQSSANSVWRGATTSVIRGTRPQ